MVDVRKDASTKVRLRFLWPTAAIIMMTEDHIIKRRETVSQPDICLPLYPVNREQLISRIGRGTNLGYHLNKRNYYYSILLLNRLDPVHIKIIV